MSDSQIFQIFSVVYIAIGIGMLINPAFYSRIFNDFTETPAILYLGGAVALIVGYIIVAFHNTWTDDLSVIITIIGWVALLKGILILTLPKIMIAITKAITLKQSTMKALSIIIIIIGLAFAFLGFCPKSPI